MKFQCLKAEIFDDLLFIETKTDQYKLKTIDIDHVFSTEPEFFGQFVKSY